MLVGVEVLAELLQPLHHVLQRARGHEGLVPRRLGLGLRTARLAARGLRPLRAVGGGLRGRRGGGFRAPVALRGLLGLRLLLFGFFSFSLRRRLFRLRRVPDGSPGDVDGVLPVQVVLD